MLSWYNRKYGYITGELCRSGISLTSNLASNYVSNSSLSNTISNLNTVNVSNASWCRYQAINISTAISIPASTSLLVLNCTYTCNVTINFNQAI